MAETVAIKVEIDTGQAAKNLGDLERSAEDLTKLLKETDFGTKEFEELNQALKDVNRQIKNTELSMEALDNEQVASELGSVAGAVGDMTAAFILLGGDEDSAIGETAKRIETALGVTMAFKGAIEGVISFQKLWNNVLKKTAIVQKTINTLQKVTMAQWALITAAATAAIALYNKYFGEVEKVKTIQEEYNEVVKESEKSVQGEIVQMNILIKTARDETLSKTARNDAIKKLQKQYPDYLGNLSLEEINTKKVDQAVKDLTKSLQLKARAKAIEGKIGEAANKQLEAELKLKDKLGLTNKELLEIQNLSEEAYEALSLLQIDTNIEFREQAEALGISNELMEAANSGLFLYIEEYKESTDAINLFTEGLIEANTAQSDLTEAQEENLGKTEEQTEAQKEAAKAAAKAEEEAAKKRAERRKKEKEAAAERLKREQQAIFDLQVARMEADAEDILDAKEKAEALIEIERFKHEKELENKKLTDAEKELLEFEYQQRIAEISQEFVDAEMEREKAEAERLAELQKEKEEKEKEAREKKDAQDEIDKNKRIEREKEVQNAIFNLASGGIDALIQLNDAFQGQTEAQQKKAFERNKKLQIAQALIGASQGVVNILSNASTIPDPFGTAYKVGQLAILAAVTTAQIAKISQQQFNAGGSASAPAISGAGGGAPTLSPITNTSTLVPQEPQQVFVTETDISNTQNKVAVIENQATIK